MSCPEKYVKFTGQNAAGFMLQNITHEGQYWINKDTAGNECDNNSDCGGLILRDTDENAVMRKINNDFYDNSFTASTQSGSNTWCVKKSLLTQDYSDNPDQIQTVSYGSTICDSQTTTFDTNLGKCVSILDITSDNSTVCDSNTTTFDADSGKCVSIVDVTSDNSTVCDPNTTTFNADSGKCVSIVDITSDNSTVCDLNTTTFDAISGKCVSTIDITSDNSTVCDSNTTTFDADSGKCVSTQQQQACNIM